MSRITRKQLRAERAAKGFQKRTRDKIEQAIAGDGAGHVEVEGRAGYIWIRLDGSADDVTMARNASTDDLEEGTPIEVRKVERYAASYYEVKGVSSAVVYDTVNVYTNPGAFVKKHAPQHVRGDAGAGGNDPVDVYARMVVPTRARQQSSPNLTVYIEPGLTPFGYWAGANSPAFVPPTAPTEVSRIDLLYLDDTLTAQILQGAPAGYGVNPVYPDLPRPSFPIAYLRLIKGQTSITEISFVRDARILGAALEEAPPSLQFATKAEILALTPEAGLFYQATDTKEIYFADGLAWYKSPFALVEEPPAPDRGYTQDSSRIGYGETYIINKLLARVRIGANGIAAEGGVRVVNGILQVYLLGAWRDVVTGVRLREDDSGNLIFEHKPTGLSEWLEVNSGDSSDLFGLNGLPTTQQYKTSRGPYPVKMVIDGGSL